MLMSECVWWNSLHALLLRLSLTLYTQYLLLHSVFLFFFFISFSLCLLFLFFFFLNCSKLTLISVSAHSSLISFSLYLSLNLCTLISMHYSPLSTSFTDFNSLINNTAFSPWRSDADKMLQLTDVFAVRLKVMSEVSSDVVIIAKTDREIKQMQWSRCEIH